MIQRFAAAIEVHQSDTETGWQQILQSASLTVAELLEQLDLPPSQWAEGARLGHELFPVRVPAPYLARIERGNPADPLLRQILPVLDESQSNEGFVADPLEEFRFEAGPGLIRKYQSRALIVVTGHCAINCRYCFRRHFPYQDHRLSPERREEIIQALAQSPEINEVILSGGDPLMAPDSLLGDWLERLAQLPTIRRVRFHTRLPVVIPQRITKSFLDLMSIGASRKVMVLHINHSAEIDDAVREAAARLLQAGVLLLNQSVLLKGVNDDAETLTMLSEDLFDAGILPYYLHAFDSVAGAHHFALPDQRAIEISEQVRARLPGFLAPRLVREVPGAESKTPLDF